ncbi:hypothetical protein Hanom_Chr13g01233231 [Helianthus anomalus]
MTNFVGGILSYYKFHISQLSPLGMVRVQHFVFTCRSQGQDPTVEWFRVFYQLQCNLGFYSFALLDTAKKILINTPKSYHDWKGQFFYTREEVIPVVMDFRRPGTIEKETLAVPKDAGWYKQDDY